MYSLSEGLASGRSFTENVSLLRSLLPELLGVTAVHVYLLDRASGALRPVENSEAPGPAALPILTEDPVGFREKTVALCFSNGSLIAVPDTHRSPFFDRGQATPRSVMCVPMFAGDDLLGVLEISDARRTRHFSEEEQAVAQHIGNQVAIGLRILEQKSLREQALGREKLDAVHQLVTAAAGEMSEPLMTIAGASRALLARHPEDPERTELARISAEARRADGIVSQLQWLAGLPGEEVRSIDLSSVVRNVMKLRQKAWEQRGIRVRDLLAAEPLFVAAAPSSLEKVLLSLFWYAEDRLIESEEKTLSLRGSRLAARAQVEIGWAGPGLESEETDPLDNPRSPAEDVLSLSVCRGLIRGNEGDIRLATAPDKSWRFEIEVPLAQAVSPRPAGSSRVPPRAVRPLTALIVEPDLSAQQSLVSMLSELGHRGLPVASVEDAADSVKRFRFHLVFCSANVAGAPWLRCFEACRGHTDAFILLTQGHDAALSSALPAGEAHALAKPVRADELSRLIEEVDARVASLRR
jgi:nitrogen-specific signal transduction histidine kinase